MIKKNPRLFFIYMFLGLDFATVMGFIYMQNVYYDAMTKTMNISNTQLGFLITIEAIAGIITSIPGGILADRFDCRKVLTVGFAGVLLSLLVFAIFPVYGVAMVVWGVASVFMSTWYSAIYKVIRIIAPKDSIGKSYGLFGIGTAIGNLIVNVAGLALYHQFAKVSLKTGLSAILWIFFICGAVSCIGAYLLMRKIEINQKEENVEKYTFKEFIKVMKNPGVWLFVAALFFLYSFHVSMSYFTPYFTAVLGTTVVFSGVVATLRQSIKVVSSPLGGWYGDKIGSVAKVIRVSMCILAGLVVVILLLHKNTPLAILVALVFIIGFFDSMNISLQASISADALVPPKQMGVAIGLTSVFTADLFQDTMFGGWLDKYGKAGYQYIWTYTVCVAIACIVVLSVMLIRKRKIAAKASENAQMAASVE